MTDQDHAKIVREAQVTQADREAEDQIYYAQHWGMGQPGEIAMRHRLAAEAAAFEKAAGVALREVRDEGNGAAVKANAGIIYQDIRKLAGEKHD